MAERKLKSRRRRRANKGKIIRVSNLVYDTLEVQRTTGVHKDKVKSWDCYLRRMLGLPDRNGKPQLLVEGVLEAMSGTFILKYTDATWSEVSEIAYKMADQIARKRKVRMEVPVRMREVR